MMSNPNGDQTQFSQFHNNSSNVNILPNSENSGKLKVEDALKYIDKVKSRFQEDVYKKFLEVMKDFKAQKINTENVIQNVLTLFNGHQDLIEGFNTFLPVGYQMSSYHLQNVNNFTGTAVQNQVNVKTHPVLATQQCTILQNPQIIKSHPDLSIKQNISISNEPITFVPKEKVELSQIQHCPTGSASYLNLKSNNQTPAEFNHAVEYVNRIKNRFLKKPDVYKRFLEILHWYQKEQKNPDLAKRKQTENEVSQEVAKLFDNERDLLVEFSTFLPESTDEVCTVRKSALNSGNFKQSVCSNSTYSLPSNLSSSNLTALNDRTNSSNVNSNKYPIFQTKNEPLLTHSNLDCGNEKDTLSPSPHATSLQSDFMRNNANLANSLNVNATNLSLGKRNLVQDSNLMTAANTVPPNKRIRTSSSSNATSLTNLPSPSVHSTKEATKRRILNNPDLKQLRGYDQIINICLKLLELPDDSGYNTFINIMNLYNRGLINAEDMKTTMKPFFNKQSPLWSDFIKILDRIQEKDKAHSDAIHNAGINSNLILGSANNSNAGYTSRLGLNDSSFSESTHERHHSTTNKSTLSTSTQITTNNPPSNRPHLSGGNSNSQMICRKNIELSKLELCGTNYRILPEEATQKHSLIQQRNPLCKEVLNFNLLCHRSLSAEDGAFVFSKKNNFEESVFKIEDERYEIDMVMEVNKAAMFRLADLQVRLKNMSNDELKEFNLDDSLYKSSTILFYKAIQRIYGDKATEIIRGLRSYPTQVVPMVLNRLKEKDAEWKEKIKEFRKQWRNQDQFLLKSLDYQAINFKTKDSAFIRPKALLNCLESNFKLKPVYLNNYEDQTQFARLVQSLLEIKRSWTIDKPEKWGSFAFNYQTNYSISTTANTNSQHLGNNTVNNTMGVISNSNNATNTSGSNNEATTPSACVSNNCGILELNAISREMTNCPSINYHMLLLFPCDVNYAKSVLDLPFQPSKQFLFDKLNWLDLLGDASSLIIHHLKRQSNYNPKDKAQMKNFMRATIQDLFIDERFPMSDDEEEEEDDDDDDVDEADADDTNNNVTSNSDNSAGSNFSRSRNRFSSRAKRNYYKQNSASNETLSGTGATHDKTIGSGYNYIKSKRNDNFDQQNHYKILFGSQNWYVFIRLYHILVDRLAALKIKAEQLKSAYYDERQHNNHDVADLLLYKKTNQITPDEYYQVALNLVKDLLDNKFEDTSIFEDQMREIFSIHAYIWFSMDRLVTTLVKQLQSISCNDTYSKLLTTLFKQCSRPIHEKDELDNFLKIVNSGTGSCQEARSINSQSPNISLISDEFNYFQAASRLAQKHKEPLVMLVFHRCPNNTTTSILNSQRTNGFMSITKLDIQQPPQSDGVEEPDEDDCDDEEDDCDDEEEEEEEHEEEEEEEDDNNGNIPGNSNNGNQNGSIQMDAHNNSNSLGKDGDNKINNTSGISYNNSNNQMTNSICTKEIFRDSQVTCKPQQFHHSGSSNKRKRSNTKALLSSSSTDVYTNCSRHRKCSDYQSSHYSDHSRYFSEHNKDYEKDCSSHKDCYSNDEYQTSVTNDEEKFTSCHYHHHHNIHHEVSSGSIINEHNINHGLCSASQFQMNNSWCRYVQQYIKCHEQLGLVDDLASSLQLDQRIIVPVFLLRSLRQSLRNISRRQFSPNLTPTKTELLNNNNSEQESEHELKEEPNGFSSCESTKLIISEDNKVEAGQPKDSCNSEWHNVIVSLIVSIFPEFNKDNLIKFLERTVITGHMCPSSDDNSSTNIINQFETNKLTWSVGSNGIFHHNKSDIEISMQERSMKTTEIRRERFNNFLDKWIAANQPLDTCPINLKQESTISEDVIPLNNQNINIKTTTQ